MIESLHDFCKRNGLDHILREWHIEKNGERKPEKIGVFSNQKVWWVCEKGHDFELRVFARTTRGTGCPYCAGRAAWPGFNDLASQAPEIAAQWHPTMNEDLTPEMVTVGSATIVWWQCKWGHPWKAAVNVRTKQKKGLCPVCNGRHSAVFQRNLMQQELEERAKN